MQKPSITLIALTKLMPLTIAQAQKGTDSYNIKLRGRKMVLLKNIDLAVENSNITKGIMDFSEFVRIDEKGKLSYVEYEKEKTIELSTDMLVVIYQDGKPSFVVHGEEKEKKRKKK